MPKNTPKNGQNLPEPDPPCDRCQVAGSLPGPQNATAPDMAGQEIYHLSAVNWLS